MKISKSKLTIFHEKAKLIFIQEQRYFDPMEKKKIFFSTQLRLSKLCSSWNEDAQKRAPLKTRPFFSFFLSGATLLQEGARHASRRRELSTGVQVTGFLILLLPCKWERADLWQKVGIWRRIELDAALAASPRQITRKKKGGKKGKGQKGGRERGNWIRIDE